MTSRDFCYWLQGLFELDKTTQLSAEQTQCIKNHLNLVFYHEIDKQYQPGDNSQLIHDGLTPLPVEAVTPADPHAKPESKIIIPAFPQHDLDHMNPEGGGVFETDPSKVILRC